jgi:hypothetical protein
LGNSELKQPAYIGVDPGLTGVAALMSKGRIEFHKFKDIKTAAHAMNIWRTEFYIKGVVLENPSLKGRGGKNLLSSKFIINLGQWEGILAAYYLDYKLVRPPTWQKKYKHLYPGSWQSKDRTLKVVAFLFPEVSGMIYLKKHNNMADALLIANYCKDIFSHGGDQMQLP